MKKNIYTLNEIQNIIKSIFDHSPIPIVLIRSNKICYCNKIMLIILGEKAKNVIRKEFTFHIRRNKRCKSNKYLSEVVSEATYYSENIYLINSKVNHDKKYLIGYQIALPTIGKKVKLIQFMEITDNYSLRKKIHRISNKIEALKRKSNKDIIKLIKHYEYKSNNISYKIYALLSHSLDEIKSNMQNILTNLDKSGSDVKRYISSSKLIIENVISYIKYSSPRSIENNNFILLVKEYCVEMLIDKPIRLLFFCHFKNFEGSKLKKMCIFRIVQEAIQTAFTSMNCTRIIISFKVKNKKLKILFYYNGLQCESKSNEDSELKKKYYSNIQEKISFLRGKIDIKINKFKGIRLICELPI